MKHLKKSKEKAGLLPRFISLSLLLCLALALIGCGAADNESNKESKESDLASKPCQHSYRENVIAPTCKDRGYTIYTCVYCNDKYTASYTNKTSTHDYKYDKVETTCTEKGYDLKTCTTCGITEKTNEAESYLRHTGSGSCTVCGINYFDAFVNLIKEKGTLVEGVPTITLTAENTKTTWGYYENENTISIIMQDLNFSNHRFGISITDSDGQYLYMLRDVVGVTTKGYINADKISDSSKMLQYIYTDYGWSTSETNLLLSALELGMSDARLCVIGTNILFSTLEHGMTMYNFGFINY